MLAVMRDPKPGLRPGPKSERRAAVSYAYHFARQADQGQTLSPTEASFPDEAANRDVITGDWRPLNFEQPPFGFPRPLDVLREGCTEQGGLFGDKSLALWRAADLPPSGSGTT
jgi:hypothetical protein